jgi:D-alanyl-lipoteichoic acid acyltransferase DltB (MBOAT superfamily)
MPENFRQPFFAKSLRDFWRRWHITLNLWLKDYLFYPIALSRPLGKLSKLTRKLFGKRIGKMLPTVFATFCVYFMMAVWHGSSVNVFIFGTINGLMISTALLMEPQLEKLRAVTGIDGEKNGFCRAFAMLRTLGIMLFLRCISRSASPADALGMMKQALLHSRLSEIWNGTLLNLGLGKMDYLILLGGVLVLLARDIITERGKDCRIVINNTRPVVQFLILFAVLVSITLFGIYADSAFSATFIYARY